MNTAPIVSRVWSFCTTLRDDGVSYGDYLEQLTYLIFLKMADEYGKPPYNRDVGIPDEYGWQSLKAKRGSNLEDHYVGLLRELGNRKGMLGQIFTKAQNKIQDPAKLYRLIDMVDDTDWITLGADVKGDIYENLLERNAEDTKTGAGQYFTPRALIRAMVECVRPEPGKRIADPACGTGGFFLGAYDFITNREHFTLDRDQKAFLKHDTFHGHEIVANTRRLCLMNLFLHNIGEIDGGVPISPNDSLVADDGERYDYVLANPPFGKKSWPHRLATERLYAPATESYLGAWPLPKSPPKLGLSGTRTAGTRTARPSDRAPFPTRRRSPAARRSTCRAPSSNTSTGVWSTGRRPPRPPGSASRPRPITNVLHASCRSWRS